MLSVCADNTVVNDLVPAGLQVLQPMPILPTRSIRHRVQSKDILKEIACLRVDIADHHVDEAMYAVNAMYTIRMYYHNAQNQSPSRIPVHGRFGDTTKQPSESSKPSAVIHVSFENFLQLRYDAYEIAKSSHEDGHSCTFVSV